MGHHQQRQLSYIQYLSEESRQMEKPMSVVDSLIDRANAFMTDGIPLFLPFLKDGIRKTDFDFDLGHRGSGYGAAFTRRMIDRHWIVRSRLPIF